MEFNWKEQFKDSFKGVVPMMLDSVFMGISIFGFALRLPKDITEYLMNNVHRSVLLDIVLLAGLFFISQIFKFGATVIFLFIKFIYNAIKKYKKNINV
jgi:hypothetical protein